MRRTLIATALLAALAAGCGGQAGSTGVASVAIDPARPAATPTPTTTADAAEQGRKFAQCMREHGIPMDDPDAKGGGGIRLVDEDIDKEKLKRAAEACRGHAPFMDRKLGDPAQIEQLRQFAQCMREHGVDMPDPAPDGGFGGEIGDMIKRDSPAFRKAVEACNDRRPKPGAAK
ncbi:MAG TPA: hypothetical protein VFV66_08765 [Nonomuraea sp.]|nr:hypothetical protein [Nonomuraea sp.]